MSVVFFCLHHSLYIAVTPPPSDASISVVALNEPGKVKVTWSRPALEAGQEISGYTLQYRRKGIASYTTCSVGSSTTSYTIANLNLGTLYEVRVASVDPHTGPSEIWKRKVVTTYNCEWTACGCAILQYSFNSFNSERYLLSVHNSNL